MAQGMRAPDDQRLDQTKPGSETEPNKVAQGMATLEQEQELWRPGVKAEQVFVYDFSFMIRLYFYFWISYPNHLYFQEDSR